VAVAAHVMSQVGQWDWTPACATIRIGESTQATMNA
jgi:hypothetical protein